MDIAFIGHGNVGGALAAHLARAGHRVVIASDTPDSGSVRAALAREGSLTAAPVDAAIEGAQVVFLAVPFAAAAQVLSARRDALAGRVLVDCTNPVGPGLTHGVGDRAGSRILQDAVPGTPLVKAFSIYGAENFAEPPHPDAPVRPAMLYCGDDADAKRTVAGLIAELGWQPVDAGGLDRALHLEHMTLLWVGMVRMGGRSPHLVWAALEG
jgi:hypothetical protein